VSFYPSVCSIDPQQHAAGLLLSALQAGDRHDVLLALNRNAAGAQHSAADVGSVMLIADISGSTQTC